MQDVRLPTNLMILMKEQPNFYVFLFFFGSCAAEDTVTIYKTQSLRQERFSLQAFKFTGFHQLLFFYCRVAVCNTSDSTIDCSRQCGVPNQHDRFKRSPGGLHYQLVEGPIIFTDEKQFTFKRMVPTERHSNFGKLF